MDTQKSKLAVYLFNLTALAVFLYLLIYSLTNNKAMVDLFSYTSYYLIFLIIIVWTVQTILFLKALNFSLKLLLKKHWIGILTALVLTSLVFTSVRVRFKTLSDETNLLSVSRSMLNDKTCLNSTMGKYYYNNLNTINAEIPKRPLVFPFLVHLLHTITGVRHQNPFILNFIVMFLFLSAAYIAARKFIDIPSSIAVIFFIISCPVFTIFGTSAGFDFLNSTFFLLIMAATYYFIKKPTSLTFSFIFASLLVFSNIRYESMIFLFVLPLLLFKKIKWHYFKDYSYLFFIAPLVSLPYLWQRILKYGSYENPADVPAFSLTSFVKNVTVFSKNLVDFEYFLPYAGLINIVGILIFIYLVIQVLRKKIELKNHESYFLIVLFTSIAISTVLYFSYFFVGAYNHPSTARFFITLSIVFALGLVVLKTLKPNLLSGSTLLIISMICFLFYHPIAVEGRFINTLKLNRRTEHCMNFIAELNDKNILIISPRPGQYTALGYGAVTFAYANENSNSTLNEAERHLYSKVIVFQQIRYEDKKPTKDTVLHSSYRLNTLYEIQVSATEFLRISEVKIIAAELTRQRKN